MTEHTRPRTGVLANAGTFLGCGVLFAGLVIAPVVLFRACFPVRQASSAPAAPLGPAALAAASPSLVREYCLDAVRDNLKAPSTARFYDARLPTFSNGSWGWDSTVEAQNAFGVPLRVGFACIVGGRDADHLEAVAVMNRP